MSLAVHRQDEADGGQEGEDRTDQRPRARIDEMIIVMRLGVRVGHSLPLCVVPTGLRAGRSATFRRRRRAARPVHSCDLAPLGAGASATGFEALVGAKSV